MKLILPLIAFAAGSLIGGAILHMIPSAVDSLGNVTSLYVWIIAGFTLFFSLEEFLNWHHSHTHTHSCGPLSPPHQHVNFIQGTDKSITCIDSFDCNIECNSKIVDESIDENCETSSQQMTPEQALESGDIEFSQKPEHKGSSHDNQIQANKQTVTYLILIADAVHNFLGGLFVGASFVDSVELGLSTWLAAAAHEVPQELGDFAILVHGGWSKSAALLFNFLSSITFLVRSIIAYAASRQIDVAFLISFAAGNFLYIGGSDLIPEVKHFHGIKENATQFVSFVVGAGIMLGIRVAMKGW
jgi:zinc transporter ZupT